METNRTETLNLTMFKQYDIRTKATSLTADVKEGLYNAVAIYMRDSVKVKSVVIGRDARTSAPQIAEGLAALLRKAGLDVIINPLPISTCQFYYSCMQNRSSAGIMVTASHNPAEYIGMKLVGPDVSPIAFGCGPDDGIRRIRELYLEGASVQGDAHGKMIVANYLEQYIDYCMRLSGVAEGSLKGSRIMLEFLNGSAGAEMALAFQKAGADIEVRNIVPDGLFLQGDPNPIIETSIAPAREAMRNGGFDFGFCFDGDGDRIDLMGPDGNQIVPGLNMAIIVKRMMDIFKGTKTDVYADVKAIPTSLCEIAKSGVKVHIIRNGHSFIKQKLGENCGKGYMAAEEESAHYYMNYPYDPDDLSKGFAAVESTLFIALVSARCYKEDPAAYERAAAMQNSLYREREWPLHCEAAPEMMPQIMDDVERRMVELDLQVIKEMDDGSDLDACLFRYNLPKTFSAQDSLDGRRWVQVAQRISRSEEAMCRWEVVSNDPRLCERFNGEIRKVTDRYVEAGLARY